MRKIVSIFVACVVGGTGLEAAEVQVKSSPSVQPTATPSTGPQSATQAADSPQYRPALLGLGASSLINRIDAQGLMNNGQKDASIMFCCLVAKNGEMENVNIYRGTTGSRLLEQELFKRLEEVRFIPAIYDRQPVAVAFYGTVTFAISNGKPRLRIFANQEAEELKKESDFIGPQPFSGKGSDFEGLYYPTRTVGASVSGIVELAMKIDATGRPLEEHVVSEEPPLLGFGQAAARDFGGAKFIPAFRDGKPVECSITLPVYYEP